MAGIDVTGTFLNTGFTSGYYLTAYDNGSQSIGAPFAINNLEFNTTVLNSGISIQGINNSDIVFNSAGNYNIQFSVQVTNNLPQIRLFYLWLCINGLSVSDSAGIMSVLGTHGGGNGHFIAAWNYLITVQAGDSVQLCWTANDIAIQVETLASPGPGIPGVPSSILSVTQV